MRAGQTIFTYFHFAADKALTEAILQSGITAVAYETVRDRNGRLPLLTPMSEVAGRMSIQEGAKYLEKPMLGRGILLAGAVFVACNPMLIKDELEYLLNDSQVKIIVTSDDMMPTIKKILQEKLPGWRVKMSIDRYIQQGYLGEDEKGVLYMDWRSRAEIDQTLCYGCGVCEQVCPFKAIRSTG
jgi:hypothetical protein